MLEESSTVQKVDHCKHNCYKLSPGDIFHSFSVSEMKTLKDLCKIFKVTPCFASPILQYLNQEKEVISCSMLYNKFGNDINLYFQIKAKIYEKQYLPSKIKNEKHNKMFNPCNHQGTCFKNKQCTCYKNGISCEMSCLCD